MQAYIIEHMVSFEFPKNLKGFHIHFTGIKGTGMAALVEILFSRGAIITGSDVNERFYTDEILEQLGIKPLPFSAANITDDINLVIHSSAYNENHPELVEASKKGIPVLLYTEALGKISASAYSCGICGVHGKTTTTGLTGTILKELDFPSQILAGSIINSFGGRCTLNMGHDYFVAETCEYQRHFMSFHPQKIILTSVESDHQDYYPEFKDIQKAFCDYIMLLPIGADLIYCADDEGAVATANIAFSQRPDLNLIPYGIKASGDFHVILAASDGKNRIRCGEQHFMIQGFPNNDFSICVPGHHLVLNAVAAIALSIRLLQNFRSSNTVTDSDIKKIQKGLLSFTGAKRRSEIIGRTKNIVFIDDYGHHPTAIKTTLAGYKEFYSDRKIIVDFMSHTYTRTASLLNQFAACFSDADEIITHKIYPSAREKYTGLVNGQMLYQEISKCHPNVRYFEEIMDSSDELLQELSDYENKNQKILFVTMGAGDNWKIGKYLYEKIKQY